MKGGEIWWADLPPPVGHRPVVLLSRDEAYRVRKVVTVALVTTTVWNIPVEVPLGSDDGLSKPCVVNLDTLMTVRKESLTQFMALLSPAKMNQVNEALKFALAIP